MTFYQELQLNQAGSKELLRKSETAQERRYHALIYLAKVAITMLFCFAFVSVFSILFGNENSVVGVVVLLCLMVFRNADFGLHTGQSTLLLALFFVDMAVFPHLAQQAAPLPALLLNVAALAFLVIFGCHNPFMFNQSTLVLGYLLLYGYDVSGDSYRMRLLAMAVGALLSCLVFYRNHKSRTYETGIKGVLQAFDLASSRTNWQLCQIICVPMVLFLAEEKALQYVLLRAFPCGAVQNAPCYVGRYCGNVCHCTADGGYAGAGEKQNHRQRGRGALLSGALYPSAYLDLCLYRNPWRYRRWLFCEVWLAGSV